MKYKVESTEGVVSIEVTETKGKQNRLLHAFQECQEGPCTCPTEEYSKLNSLEITSDEDTIKLKLKPKPGVKFDESEIGNCLEYTRGKVISQIPARTCGRTVPFATRAKPPPMRDVMGLD